MIATRPALRGLDRASTVLCALALAALLAVAGTSLAGHRLLVERSDSMRPALGAGDLLVDESVRASAIRPGNVVTYADRARGGRLITHRVVSVARAGGSLVFTTRGDANTATESFAVPADAGVQRVAARARGLGRVAIALSRVPRWAPLLAIAALAAAPGLARYRRRS